MANCSAIDLNLPRDNLNFKVVEALRVGRRTIRRLSANPLPSARIPTTRLLSFLEKGDTLFENLLNVFGPSLQVMRRKSKLLIRRHALHPPGLADA